MKLGHIGSLAFRFRSNLFSRLIFFIDPIQPFFWGLDREELVLVQWLRMEDQMGVSVVTILERI